MSLILEKIYYQIFLAALTYYGLPIQSARKTCLQLYGSLCHQSGRALKLTEFQVKTEMPWCPLISLLISIYQKMQRRLILISLHWLQERSKRNQSYSIWLIQQALRGIVPLPQAL